MRVEDPVEIYADKIKATLSRMKLRGSIKPTDLFDLNYLTTSFKTSVSASEVQRKADSYGEYSLLDAELFKSVVAYIRDPKNHAEFVRNFSKTMVPDFFRASQFNADYFSRAAQHFEKYAS